MTIKEYLYDNLLSLVLNLTGMGMLFFFLLANGDDPKEILYLVLVWVFLLLVYCSYRYRQLSRNYHCLLEIAAKLDKKYLIAEVIGRPRNTTALPYFLLMKIAQKSMLEELTLIKNNRKEYKEYIEQWVHEIKTPISAIKLSAENNKSEVTRYILSELENLEQYVDQALFYARSEHVEQDYLIRECSLVFCVHECLTKHKQMFIKNKIKVQLEGLDKNVYTDKKWLSFIITQLLINAVQYKKASEAMITITSENVQNGVKLMITDNGIGIAAHELQRVFEKGFTGSNGRRLASSTGIGLYLCRKLSLKLGLILEIESEEGLYTQVSLFFPKGSFNIL